MVSDRFQGPRKVLELVASLVQLYSLSVVLYLGVHTVGTFLESLLH